MQCGGSSFWDERCDAAFVVYAIPIPSVRPSVRHTGGLWPHRSTDRNNLGVVGKPQHSNFGKNKNGLYRSPQTLPNFGANGEW